MKLSKIDLSNIVAINHDQDKLGLLIDRGSEMEYLEVPAPRVAYQGLNQVANLASQTSSVPCSSISSYEDQTDCNSAELVAHPTLSIANQPDRVSYSAAVEVDKQRQVVRVQLTCELVYSLEESCDFDWEDEE